MSRIFAASILAVLTAACQPASEKAGSTPDLSHTDPRCAPDALQGWIGMDTGLFDPAPGENVRIQTPGSVVSGDYQKNRLTLYVDQDGLVQRAECG